MPIDDSSTQEGTPSPQIRYKPFHEYVTADREEGPVSEANVTPRLKHKLDASFEVEATKRYKVAVTTPLPIQK
jgi:hypothetical protein